MDNAEDKTSRTYFKNSILKFSHEVHSCEIISQSRLYSFSRQYIL